MCCDRITFMSAHGHGKLLMECDDAEGDGLPNDAAPAPELGDHPDQDVRISVVDIHSPDVVDLPTCLGIIPPTTARVAG